MVRCKFKVEHVGKIEGFDDLHVVRLSPVISGSEENKLFWKYTPAGTIEMQTTNAEAAAQFELGKAYYVDFTPEE